MEPKPPKHDYLKLRECAEVLRCSEKSILRLIQDGTLVGFRVRAGSSRWLIARDSFLRFIADRTAAAENS